MTACVSPLYFAASAVRAAGQLFAVVASQAALRLPQRHGARPRGLHLGERPLRCCHRDQLHRPAGCAMTGSASGSKNVFASLFSRHTRVVGARQEPVDPRRRLLTRGDGLHHGGRAARRVPSGKHPFHRRLARHGIARQVLPLVQLHRRRPSKSSAGFSVWPMAAITMSACEREVVLALWPRASGGPSGRNRPAPWCGTSRPRRPCRPFSTSSSGAARNSNFTPSRSASSTSSVVRRHLRPRAAVDHRGGLRAQAQGRARRVHRRVAAADDHDVRARPSPCR